MESIALIFDHDGTLVDSECLHFQCWQEVMGLFNIDITEQEYIQGHNGIPTLQNAEVFVRQYRLSETPESLAARKQDLFKRRSVTGAPKLMPTVMDTLALARSRGFKMGIATGAGREDLDRSIVAHGLSECLDVTVTRSEVPNGKPAPDVYLLACERLGVAPQQSFAFEDTAAGVAAAKAAGLTCIAIPNDYSKQQDLSSADQLCISLMEAYRYVIEQLG